jgi:uncharacterized protein (DUF2164 family)
MKKRKAIWDVISDKRREECIRDIIGHFQDERGEEMGLIGAEQILDLVLEKIVWGSYNKGVSDIKAVLQDKFADINVDLDLLIRE